MAAAEFPSRARAVPGPVNISPARFPAASKTSPNDKLDVVKIAAATVDALNAALGTTNYKAASELFVDQGYWRDHLALSWEFRTVQGPQAVLGFLQSSSKSRDGLRLKRIRLDTGSTHLSPKIVPLGGSGQLFGMRLNFNLETAIGAGRGVAYLVESGGSWKFFTLYTCLQELKGHEEGVNERRPMGHHYGANQERKNWADKRSTEAEYKDGSEPTVLIVGAGQAGLTAAARLKMLGLDALIIDQNDRVGDNWRNRYRQLVLHDPVWGNHLPYMPFPPQWPIYTPKDKLANFLQFYADVLELNVWMKTKLGQSKYDEEKGVWTVMVRRKKDDGSFETRTFHPRHIIQATGHSGKKNMPQIKGIKDFKGHLLCHSSEFVEAREDGKGKKAVVVGSCNSGHDIAQDFAEKGYDVTMVQRSSTLVVSVHALLEIALKDFFSDSGPPTEDADILFQGVPLAVMKANHILLTKRLEEHDQEMLDGLARAGFKLDKGPNDAGIFIKYFQNGGGYYMNVGASQLIADGRIKVKQGQEIAEVLPHGLRFADGTELEADEVVLATGYQNMRTQTQQLFGDAVADRVNDVWGINAEGETRTIWQRSGHPGFWFHGGNLGMCRYYSRLLALQIKGLEAGLYQHGET